ncbi:hypothetical protein [Streptomyces sp. NPDC057889]|uniref:hypothetical protein n=1 Tax=unclassified Streptomyces TaxID=2593676 RepID=UPI0036968F3A
MSMNRRRGSPSAYCSARRGTAGWTPAVVTLALRIGEGDPVGKTGSCSPTHGHHRIPEII